MEGSSDIGTQCSVAGSTCKGTGGGGTVLLLARQDRSSGCPEPSLQKKSAATSPSAMTLCRSHPVL